MEEHLEEHLGEHLEEQLEEQLQEEQMDEVESRVSVLIQEIPVVDSRQGATTSSECSQGRSR